MSLGLYTVLQVPDDLLPEAVTGFEEMTRVTHPTAMHQLEQIRQSTPGQEPAAYGKDEAPRVPVLRHPHALPLRAARPETPRRSTAPDSPMTDARNTNTTPQSQQRNSSPYSRGQMRTRSAIISGTSSQPILRAHSLPPRAASPASLSPSIGSSSPIIRSPNLSYSPFRPTSPQSTSPSFHEATFETISEHAELDLTRSSFDSSRPITTLNSASRAVNPPRRPRTASPSRSPLTTSASSPSLSAQKYNNEGFPSPSPSQGLLYHHSSYSSLSSMPSTPSTTRSRSPSISSLETIEDVPDAEWQALEAERIARLKAVEEQDEDDEDDTSNGGVGVRRSGSLDIPSTSRGFGFARLSGGGGGARKRWSVCGAERRADLDLETIWED